jgi:hypothetical protein
MLCDVCRGSETKAKEDFRQFRELRSKSGAHDEGRTHVQQQSNVLNKMILLQVALTHPPLLQIEINLI